MTQRRPFLAAIFGTRNPPFERVYAQHYARVYRFACRLCSDVTVAEDLTMDTFNAALQAWATFEHRSSIDTWLYRIAVYKWRAMRERDRIRTRQLVDEPLAAVVTDVATDIVIQDAIAALPDDLRLAFQLVRLEGLKYREAADVLECPIGTIQSRVHDASQILRRRLGPALGYTNQESNNDL